MLPKINRLTATGDFKNVFGKGKTCESGIVRVKFVKNCKNFSRFGFIVSTKFYKKASKRNLIKRQLRAAVLFLFKKVKPGYDIIVWPREPAKSKDYKSIKNDLRELLTKNDILSF
ncbi:MAG: ribonuclease P protein component [Candidatus Azambacteria bacterium]|nr:ribonuclease P protein component [Candidatus Azambacteria bacterium]